MIVPTLRAESDGEGSTLSGSKFSVVANASVSCSKAINTTLLYCTLLGNPHGQLTIPYLAKPHSAFFVYLVFDVFMNFV